MFYTNFTYKDIEKFKFYYNDGRRGEINYF